MIRTLVAIALGALVGTSSVAAAAAPLGAAEAPPTLSAAAVGPPQPVFDTRRACEQTDIPDAPARAFRDEHNLVHLIATHSIARAMVGPSLDALKRDCRVIYRSPKDRDPSHFEYNNWLFSFFTSDGRRIAALVHSEFDADEIPGLCATPKDPNNCWWNTVTFAQSLDGGLSFAVPKPPANLVAAIPYRYVVGNRASAYGYNGPTNIVKRGDFYYAMVNDWPYKAQKYGPCLIRTANPFDPRSWRAWDGKVFTIRFVDPYRETNFVPEQHVCPPVLPGAADSLVEHAPSGLYVITLYGPDDRFGGPPGFYIEGSRDLVHWGKPALVVKLSDLRAGDGPGKWTYGYESLLDPASRDRNFATLTDAPYLYYVRMDGNHPPYARVLFRRRVRIKVEAPPAAASHSP